MSNIKNRLLEIQELDFEQVIQIYEQADAIIEWLNSIKMFVKDRALNGTKIDGFKLVKGRLSRTWQTPNADDAQAVLKQAGYREVDFYEFKFMSPAKIEKLTGKEFYYTKIAPYVIEKHGEPILVRDDDKRKEVLTQSASEIFKKILAETTAQENEKKETHNTKGEKENAK